MKVIAENYIYYTENISQEGMPISLETANFMYYLCNKLKFKTLMDRGSGFSSFVLRLYAKEQDFPVKVYSVDDHPEWLEKTREYLKANNLNAKNLYLWKDFYRKYKDNIKFDFILEDGKLKLRTSTPKELVSFIDSEGFILWDDAHYKTHRTIIKKQSGILGFETIDIEEITKDKFGRYASLTTKNEINFDEYEKSLLTNP